MAKLVHIAVIGAPGERRSVIRALGKEKGMVVLDHNVAGATADVCIVHAKSQRRSLANIITARRKDLPLARVLVLHHLCDGDQVLDALVAGAQGYMLWPLPADELVQAMRTLMRDHLVLSPSALLALVLHLRRKHTPIIEGLSEREQEVLHLLADGLTYKRIGEKLFISPYTVKNQVHRIYQKLGVRTRIDAVRHHLNDRAE